MSDPLTTAQQIDRLCDQFEDAWLAGDPPSLADLLLQMHPEHQPALFQALLELDLEYRDRNGNRLQPEAYLTRFPEHASTIHEVLANNPGSPGSLLSANNSLPLHLGHYEILEEIGRGAMGVVYKARQQSLNRLVALKMMSHPAYAGEREREHLLKEAKTTAKLSHTNIVQIYEVGQTEGAPFLCLELCTGGNLDSWLSGKPQPADLCAEVIQALAMAIDSAHGSGVIHRDLKPANILLAQPEVPLVDALRISDFGLARQLDATAHSQSGRIVGTPSYMAPEQARGSSRAIGPAVDIYALGAILYEMLTGRPPYRGPSPMETLRLVIEQKPVAVRSLQPGAPRDLETICMKCLRTDPARRYPSAKALAEDLGRFRRKEPIQARPVGPLERVGQWCRRNALVASLLALVALSLVGGAGGITLFAIRAVKGEKDAIAKAAQATANEAKATAQRDRAERLLYQHSLTVALQHWWSNRMTMAQAALAQCPVPLRGWEHGYVYRLAHKPFRLPAKDQSIRAVGQTANGIPLVATSGLTNDTITIWEANNRRPRWTLSHTDAGKSVMAFDPKAEKLFVGTRQGHTDIFSLKTHKVVGRIPPGDQKAGSVSAIVPLNNGHGVIRFQPLSATLISLKGGEKPRQLLQLTGPVARKVVDPLDQFLAIGDLGGGIRILRLPTGEGFWSWKPHKGIVHDLSFNPSGTQLASAGDRTVKIWDVKEKKLLHTLTGHYEPLSLSWSPDGKFLASGDADGRILVHEAKSGKEWLTIRSHETGIIHLMHSPDGRTCYAITHGSGDNRGKIEVGIHDAIQPPQMRTYPQSGRLFVVHPDSESITTFRNRQLRTWSLTTGEEEHNWTIPKPNRRDREWSFLNPNGKQLLLYHAQQKQLRVISTETGKVSHSQELDPGTLRKMALAPQTNYLVTVGERNPENKTAKTVAILDLVTRQQWQWQCTADETGPVAFNSSGKRMALGTRDIQNKMSWIHVFSIPEGNPRFQFRVEGTRLADLTFSPNGDAIASAHENGSLCLWSLRENRKVREWKGHGDHRGFNRVFSGGGGGILSTPQGARAVAFSPNGQRLASSGSDGMVRIWRASTGEELLAIPSMDLVNRAEIFSPDHPRPRLLHPDLPHWPIQWLTFSPNGKRLIGVSMDGDLCLWDSHSR